MLDIKTSSEAEKLTIALIGSLDTNTSPDFEKVLKDGLDGVSELILDLKDLDYISSTGLRVVLSAQKTINGKGKMVIKNVKKEVLNIFEITGFVDILDIEGAYEELEDVQINTGDYLLENRLKTEAPNLHQTVKANEIVLHNMLESFFSWFPDFTDHSILHSLDVLDFSNHLLGEQVDRLSISECYVLIMACYLHDIGMGVNKKDFDAFIDEMDPSYRANHPNETEADMIRKNHNELSGYFIKKYAKFFDIPSDELTFAIIQVSRGHRKTDLLDEKEYPTLHVGGEIIRTAFLSAVIRLADEIDVGVDRNPELLFDTSNLTKQVDIDAFGTHESIRLVEVTKDAIVLHVVPKEPRFEALVFELAEKIQSTLDYCRKVAQERSDLRITQTKVEVKHYGK